MANLHGYGEYQPDNQQRRQPRTLQEYFGDGIKRFPFIGAQVIKTNPRQMHYFEMLQNNYFPGYRIQSITTLAIFVYIVLAQIIFFQLSTLLFSIITFHENQIFDIIIKFHLTLLNINYIKSSLSYKFIYSFQKLFQEKLYFTIYSMYFWRNRKIRIISRNQ